MATDGNEDLIRVITSTIQARPGLCMDDLILSCRPHPWNQVFLTLAALTRAGVVKHRPHGGFYTTSPSLQPIAERRRDRAKRPSEKRDTPLSSKHQIPVNASASQARHPAMI